MKIKLGFLSFALALAIPTLALSSTHQVVGLNNVACSTIIIPGSDTKVIIIQNNGSGDVRISVDGGATFYANGGHGTNPTMTTGYVIKGGQTPADKVIISTGPYTGLTPDPTLHKPIVAILGGNTTTTLDIITDGVADSYPAN